MDQEERHAYQLAVARNPALIAQERQAADEKDQKEEQEKNKMGWGVFLLTLPLSIIADTIEIITLGTLGWFIGLGIDFILFLILGFTRAGRKQWKKLISALLAESVPFINVLPIRTIMLIWSFMASRSKLLEMLSPKKIRPIETKTAMP